MTDNDQDEPERTEDKGPIKELSSLEEIYDRKKLLQITASLIEETYSRVSGERFRPRDGDKERLAYLRTLKELLALHADLLKASHAPPYQGLPEAPDEEDLELEAARKREFRDLERAMYGLRSHQDQDLPGTVPGKRTRKASGKA